MHLILLDLIQPANVQYMMTILCDIANMNILPYQNQMQTLLQNYPYSDPNQIYVPNYSYQLLNYNDCFFMTVFSNLYS